MFFLCFSFMFFLCHQNSSDPLRDGSTEPLGVCSGGVWHQDIGKKSFGWLHDGASVDQACLCASCGYLIGLESGKYGGQVGCLGFFACQTLCIMGCGAPGILVLFIVASTDIFW